MIQTTPLRTEVFSLGQDQAALSPRLLTALDQFIRAHYRVTKASAPSCDVLKAQQTGALAVFYNDQKKIIGFTRLFRQKIQQHNKFKIIFSTITYHDQAYNPNWVAARFTLTETMKYQLSHPHDELICLAQANTPARYFYLAMLNDVVYPAYDEPVPQEVMDTIEQLKQLNGWSSPQQHPMIIKDQLALLPYKAMRDGDNNELCQHFKAINPDYYKGEWLLMYIPLNINAIAQRIKKVVTATPYLSECLAEAS